MTSWWWLRHGPTHANVLVGWSDVPADLSDSDALNRLRAFLPDQAVLVSSDLSRARATADALAGPGHVRLPDTPQIREFNFGEWEGLDFNQVAARDPQIALQFWQNPGQVAAPQGESWNALSTRVSAWVDDMQARVPALGHGHVVAVAHFGVILTQLQRALDVPTREALAHRIDNLSVTRLDWDGDAWQVGLVNHLP